MTTTLTPAPSRTRRLTGFQPTGHLHLGNLLGALRPLIAAQDRAESIAMIADLHALTREHNPDIVRALTLEQATVLIAAGVDPTRTAVLRRRPSGEPDGRSAYWTKTARCFSKQTLYGLPTYSP